MPLIVVSNETCPSDSQNLHREGNGKRIRSSAKPSQIIAQLRENLNGPSGNALGSEGNATNCGRWSRARAPGPVTATIGIPRRPGRPLRRPRASRSRPRPPPESAHSPVWPLGNVRLPGEDRCRVLDDRQRLERRAALVLGSAREPRESVNLIDQRHRGRLGGQLREHGVQGDGLRREQRLRAGEVSPWTRWMAAATATTASVRSTVPRVLENATAVTAFISTPSTIVAATAASGV